ncbi:hypothetical protein B0J14DRAFT_647440 [Halenospora varia]|nr:hypothetical protein B0J14DRAFT_647440 [Halenospora varia]
MVQGKKVNDMNGASKPNMAFQKKDLSDLRGGNAKNNDRVQNGNASFRTDTAISGGRNQGERPLQRWVPDVPEGLDGSLESTRMKSSTGAGWDQFAENERLFGSTTDYDENIYTTTINKHHPDYEKRMAYATKKAREIESSAATNSHVAEERVRDNVSAQANGLDEEDKYSGVRRQQDFPPLSSSNNKYTPPARRAPTGQSTVPGAPVDPAIISSQLARPDKAAADKKTTPVPKAPKEVATPPTTTESSVIATPEPKPSLPKTTAASSSRTASPQVKAEGAPNATATVERDVASAFKNFASQQRRNVEHVRLTKAKNDKEIKLNDLKKFADSFKLNTPVPSDLVSIIAKDPAKQKEIQEKAKRNAEEAKANPSEAAKPIVPIPEARPTPRPVAATHGTSPSNVPSRQNPSRPTGFPHQGGYNRAAQSQQPIPAQQPRPQPGTLGARLRNTEQQHQQKQGQIPLHPIPVHEARAPPTGPSNISDPNFSRRSSGVASAQGGRLNPNSSEFKPNPRSATFNPNGNPSSGSSPRSAAVENQPATPVTRSLLKRKPIPASERPSFKGKFNALEHIMTIKPGPEKNWKATGGLKPAYDTIPTWRQVADDEKPDSTMHLTYTKLFEMTPFPPQTMSPPNPSNAVPQVPHQHQLPFHLQHGNQHGHGPGPQFNGPDDHRMMPSQSAQSFASPRLHNVPMTFPSPMNQPAQLAYQQGMMPYPGGPPIPPYRSLSQSGGQFPQQPHMGPAIMMQNPAGSFLTSQGMAPGPQMMYPQNGQGHFMPPGNGHPMPVMPGVNGYPSPGRSAPMMMSQNSQQGHQQPQMFNGMAPGMSPGPQYGSPAYNPQQGQPPMPMRGGYGGPNQFGTSPQQMHQFGPQHRNNHPNGNYNNNKNFQPHGQHPNGPPNNQIPNGPQPRANEGGEEAK